MLLSVDFSHENNDDVYIVTLLAINCKVIQCHNEDFIIWLVQRSFLLCSLHSDQMEEKKIMNIHTPSQDSVSISLSLLGYIDAIALTKATKLS